MKALIIYCHPSEDSFNAGILETTKACLEKANADYRVIDLYKDGFDPTLGKAEWEAYLNGKPGDDLVAKYVEAIKWCDSLIFIYPTWWYGQPAMLKGWLERVMIPGVAFEIRDDMSFGPCLTHVRNLVVLTTCGATQKLTWLMGAPGKKTLLRGIRYLCHWRCKTLFAAHYVMDQSTPLSRALHIQKIETKLHRFLKIK